MFALVDVNSFMLHAKPFSGQTSVANLWLYYPIMI